MIENEKLCRKHRKAQHRRDHYARLYYRCQADLDEKKLELHYARVKIKELKAQSEYQTTPIHICGGTWYVILGVNGQVVVVFKTDLVLGAYIPSNSYM